MFCTNTRKPTSVVRSENMRTFLNGTLSQKSQKSESESEVSVKDIYILYLYQITAFWFELEHKLVIAEL